MRVTIQFECGNCGQGTLLRAGRASLLIRPLQVSGWRLAHYYDRRTFHVCQDSFPNKSAWQKLERALRGTFNEDHVDQLTGRVSLPFEPGEHHRIAVKMVDQRRNEVGRGVINPPLLRGLASEFLGQE